MGREKMPWAWALAVGALAFAVRAVVATQLLATPLFERPQLDSAEFLVWAQHIADGDFFRWAAPSHGPGYAWFLAALLILLRGSMRAIALVQAAMGAALCVVAASIAARVFRDRRAGLAAGLLLAVYAPLIYVEVSLFAEGLFTFLLVLALWMFGRGQHPIAVGLLIGAATITRGTALPLVPALALIVALGWTQWTRKSALWLVVAWLAVVAPVLVLLRQTAGAWIPVQVFGGLNFYMGNHPGASGTPEDRLGGSWDVISYEPARHGISAPAAQERYFMQKAWREIGAHPGGTLQAIGRKIVWLVQHDEVRDNYNFFRTQSALLRLGIGFGLVFPLAVWGLWLAIRERRLPHELTLYLLLFAASNVFIVVSCRYRIPLVPILAAMAGGALVWIVDRARAREWKALAPAMAVVIAAALASLVWKHAPSHDYSEEWAMSAASLGSLGRYDEAQQAVDRALEANRNAPLAWFQSGILRLRQQDSIGAAQALATAVKLNPNYHHAALSLGILYKQRGDFTRAEELLRRAYEIAPDDRNTLLEYGETLLERAKLDEARRLLRQVVAADPQNERAWLDLARLEGAARNPKAGVEAASKAAELDRSKSETWMLMTMLALDAGDAASAGRALDEAERLMGADAPPIGFARALLARLQGDRDDADRRLKELLTRYPDFGQAAQLLLANAGERGTRADAEAFLRSLPRQASSSSFPR